MTIYNQNIPTFLQSKSIVKYFDTLISFGIKSFKDLNEEEKDRLSSLIIDELDNDLFDILDINEDENYDIKSIIECKFSDSINELLSEIIEENNFEYKIYKGFIPRIDRQNGELIWLKS